MRQPQFTQTMADGAWNLAGSVPPSAPRRAGSRTTAAERFNAPLYTETVSDACRWNAIDEGDLSDDEDELSVVELDGMPLIYEACTVMPSAVCKVSRPVKVRFLQTPHGTRRLEVPRGYVEAMRHERAPQLWCAMQPEMGAQRDCHSF